MKKLTILASFLLLISGLNIKAQTSFSVAELERLCGYSPAQFETFALSKGYHNSDISTEKDLTYLADNSKSYAAASYIARQIEANTVLITHRTTDKSYYLNFIDALPKERYRFIETESFPASTSGKGKVLWHYYTNGQFEVKVYNKTDEDGIASYYILVSAVAKSKS